MAATTDEPAAAEAVTAPATKTTEGAKVIDPASMDDAEGSITFCTGKDTTGNATEVVKHFNKANGPGMTAKLVEFPASADEQRNQFIQRQQAKSGDCDVFDSDVIWTAEFASQKWLYDMTPYLEPEEGGLHRCADRDGDLRGQALGRPGDHRRGVHLLRHRPRSTRSRRPGRSSTPAAKQEGGIVFQGAPYEGLTCDWLEIAFAAGGSVVSEDGTKATINSPENVAATKLMADGVKNGTAPKAVTTYMEPESLAAWQTGKYAMMRNWPYAYAISQGDDSPKIKGNFDVAPFPSFEGGGKAGILGGHNLVVSAFSKNPGGALKFIDYYASPEYQEVLASEFSLAPVLSETYESAKVKKAFPFAADLKQAVTQAKARPVSPVYPQISQAIYKNVNAALSGGMSPEEAHEAGSVRHREGARDLLELWPRLPPSRQARRTSGAPGKDSRSAAWRSSWCPRRWRSSPSSRPTPSSTPSGCRCTSTACASPD